MVSRTLWSSVLAGAIGLQIGCSQAQIESWAYPSMRDVKDLAKLEQAQHTAHDDNMTEQHIKMHPETEDEIRALKADFDARVAELAKRTEALTGSVAENFRKIVEAALTAAGKYVGLDSVTETVADLGDESDAARDERAETATTMGNATTLLTGLSVDLSKLEQTLASLSEGTREALAKASAESISKLDTLREKEAEFRRELETSLNLSKTQMQELAGMSPNEIMALLGLGGAAAGIGVAGGRTGKSRSHAELESLRETVSELAAEIEREKPPTA